MACYSILNDGNVVFTLEWAEDDERDYQRDVYIDKCEVEDMIDKYLTDDERKEMEEEGKEIIDFYDEHYKDIEDDLEDYAHRMVFGW